MKNKRTFTFKRASKLFLLAVLTFLISFAIYFFIVIRISPPEVADKSVLQIEVQELDTDFYATANSRLRKSESGLWELYVEGAAFERGVINGKLTKHLVRKQEEAFVDEIKKIIPSESYLKFLKYFIGWFNRNIQNYIPEEYLLEIYGVSFSAPAEFSYIGTNYERILNYHGAHDIGHALNDLAMVGCTSFSVNGFAVEDSTMITGRNFDFYVGERFAEDKIVSFYNPDRGHKFAMITWGGFVGVVSGMNEQGLTVTLNAAKSEIPASAAEPISLIAREILQYAKNLDEALKIAESRNSFVSEALMISSYNDKKTAIIEITPSKVDIYESNNTSIIGPNHFQSTLLKNTESNKKNISESSSAYRYERMQELINQYPEINYEIAAKILRNKTGLNDTNIGMTNEKNICQLISHHSIIFKPDELKFWISVNPFQLGKYVCYDLDSVFRKYPGMQQNQEIYEAELTIPADSFLINGGYDSFKRYKQLEKDIKIDIKQTTKEVYSSYKPKALIKSNPEYYYVYELAGDYCFAFDKFVEAQNYYKQALQKEITTVPNKKRIEERIIECTE